MSNTDILQRATDAHGINLDIDRADPLCITKAFELFQISTHNVQNLLPQNRYKKRELFVEAQAALEFLHDHIVARLGVDTANFDADALEEAYPPKHMQPIQMQTWSQNKIARYTALTTVYSRILRLRGDELTSLGLANCPEVKTGIRIALGEQVLYTFDDTQKTTLNALGDAGQGNANEQLAWTKLMYEFATGILIHLAVSVAEKFNWQSVELLGTRVPSGLF
jgi:hypothetical protein